MTQDNETHSNIVKGIALRFGAIVVTLAVQAALLFGGAGTLNWPWAWVYLGISLAIFLINGALMLRISPETIADAAAPGRCGAGTRL